MIIAMLSQKGGVGKSTISRLLAVATAKGDEALNILIADCDPSQATSFHWHSRRLEAAIEPTLNVQQFGRVSDIMKVVDNYDLIIIDGAPHSTRMTLEIAGVANLVVIPTGAALDDLRPAVLLAHELKQKGILANRLVFVLNHVITNTELTDARDYLQATPYTVLQGGLTEKRGYKTASNEGRSAIETRFATLNAAADKLAQAIIDALPDNSEKEKVA